MSKGITVRILGDYGPFSSIGKSIGYQVTIGSSSFLVDCGSPLFQQVGGQGLKLIKGLIVTHCHDDHKRWFTDLALYSKYSPEISRHVSLFTSEEVNEALAKGARSALDTSLSTDGKRIVDLSYDDYIDFRILGPRPKYRIVTRAEGGAGNRFAAEDRDGNLLGPDQAKIFIGKSGKPRLLFRDPHYNEWVEPESFYGFDSPVFYEQERNIYHDEEGFTVEAIKGPVWHGIAGIGLRFSTGSETLVFSSDTAHNVNLWQQLYQEKRTPRHSLTCKEFAEASVIFGDINDYIERTWSEERYKEAVAAFSDAVTIHDVSSPGSVVHTYYNALDRTVLDKEKTILTHSPDLITSEWILSQAGKHFRIEDNRFFELLGDRLYPLNADIYHKEKGRFYAGYRNAEGKLAVCRQKNGMLSLHDAESPKEEPLYRVDLYEDIEGGYYPHLGSEALSYQIRPDGKVELVEYDEDGSRGRVVENCREQLTGSA